MSRQADQLESASMHRGLTASVTTLNEPLVFETYLRPQIWGGDGLGRHLDKPLPRGGGPFGEAWEVSALADHPSRVVDGPFRGESLIDLWQHHSADITGTEAASTEFPLLIKWLDCREPFSVQVHPNDSMARSVLGQPHGKSEAWVIVHAEPASRAYAGLRPGMTRAELDSHLAAGTVTECLHAFVPRVGDCLWLPAGTVHSMGGGVVLAEVQQPSDATFRLFDWNRVDSEGQPRLLQRDWALQALDWKQGPVSPTIPVPLDVSSEGVCGESLLNTSVFRLERFAVERLWTQPYVGEMTIWMVLAGAAELFDSVSGLRRELPHGSTVLIPSSAGETVWTPRTAGQSCTLLCVRLPTQ